MVAEATQGLTRVKELNQDRHQRARELKAAGKKIVAYLCIYPVLEMMTALDIVPHRIFGDPNEPITEADTYMPTVVCPFLRSCLDVGMKGKYDFLDGAVFSHVCEVGARMGNYWDIAVGTPYSHFIDTPHALYKSAQEEHKELLKDFQKSLESFTGKELTPERLKEAIKTHNQQRALVRELYDLKKPDPPLISGTETIQVMLALMSLPIEEGSKLLREVINEVKERKDGPTKKPARLLVWGPVIDTTPFMEMIESLDANAVIDDCCVGSRPFFMDVPVTDDPLDGLAYHYQVELKCPRTLRQAVPDSTKYDYKADLEARFSYLGDYAKDWNANGVILQVMRYCDIHSYEVPPVKDYFDSIGLSSIYLERDYSDAALALLRTRVQGLLEVIG